MNIFQKNIGVLLLATFTTFLWGAAFPFIKLSYRELGIASNDIGTMIVFAGERFFLAGLFIFLVWKLMRQPIEIPRQQVSGLFQLGIFQTYLSYTLFYIGLGYTTGVQGSIIVGSTSIFQMILAVFMFKEAFTGNKMVGLVFGLLGIIVIHFDGLSSGIHIGFGEWAMFASVLVSAYGNTYSKKVVSNLPPAVVAGTQMTLGGLMLLITGSILGGEIFVGWTWAAFGYFAILVFISSCSLFIWTTLLKYNTVGKVSIFMFLIPVFGVFLSAWLVGEKVGIEHFIGLAFVILGIVIVFGKDAQVKKSLVK